MQVTCASMRCVNKVLLLTDVKVGKVILPTRVYSLQFASPTIVVLCAPKPDSKQNEGATPPLGRAHSLYVRACVKDTTHLSLVAVQTMGKWDASTCRPSSCWHSLWKISALMCVCTPRAVKALDCMCMPEKHACCHCRLTPENNQAMP